MEMSSISSRNGAGVEPVPTLADKAYRIVERMIVLLELPPGTVFSEAQLSDAIGIGRTPLREGLQRLAHAHLVEALPRRGMRVTEINLMEYFSMLETRRVLDRLIAESSARRRTEDQALALRTCAVQMAEAAGAGNADRFLELDAECDAILAEAAGNPFAVSAVAPTHAHCRRFWSRYRSSGDLPESSRLHSAMMEAVADGNSLDAGRYSDALLDYLDRFTREAVELT